MQVDSRGQGAPENAILRPRGNEGMNEGMNEGLTTREASKILGVSVRTVHTYVEKGKLHPIKDEAGRYRFSRSELASLGGMNEASVEDEGGMNEGMNEVFSPSVEDASKSANGADEASVEGMNEAPVSAFIPSPETLITLDRKTYEALLHRHEGLLVRLGQVEAEKRQLAEQIKLLEAPPARLPWWRRWLKK